MDSNGPGGSSLVGLVLGLVGALLDFYSAYQALSYQSGTAPGSVMPMVQNPPPEIVWGVAMAALGAAVLVTALAGVSRLGVGHMSAFGSLMAAYGALMLIIGAAMILGATPMVQSASFAGLAMLAVGTLMTINGVLMFQSNGRAVNSQGREERNRDVVTGGAVECLHEPVLGEFGHYPFPEP